MLSSRRLVSCTIFITFLTIHGYNSQQIYINNRQLDCSYTNEFALGYTCNSPGPTTCQSYLTFRSQPPVYNTANAIAGLLNSNPNDITTLNNLSSNSTIIPANTLVVVPISDCLCAGGRFYQHNTSYVIRFTNETYFLLANNTFEGLTTCQAMISQNSFDYRKLVIGNDITIPLRCACPTSNQLAAGIRYLLTYLITWGDTLQDMSQTFGNVGIQRILDAHGLNDTETIFPFTPILIPLTTRPINTSVSPALPPAPPTIPVALDGGGSSLNIGVFVGVGIAGLTMLGLISALYIWNKRKWRSDAVREGRTVKVLDKDLNSISKDGSIELAVFSLSRISKATDNFSIANQLGEGGFGPVYKGVLEGGLEIAVKRLSKSSRQGIDEFENEVICIAKLQHRNLVKLLGYCIQRDETMLVYEYMHNKSLDWFIFDDLRKSLLDWPQRFHIINGIARGLLVGINVHGLAKSLIMIRLLHASVAFRYRTPTLLYLHQDSRLRVVHRDLKAGNILLDRDMNPKISDFGLARMFKGHESEANTKRVVGTLGYISPEYAVNGLFSVKSDIFSFGVLVLEIVSGKKNTGFAHEDHHDNLLGYAWRLYKEGKSLDLIDTSLGKAHSVSEMLRSVHIGLLCVQQLAEDRPTTPSVVSMLGGEGSLPSPKQPGFFIQGSDNGSTSNLPLPSSINGATLTQVEGR